MGDRRVFCQFQGLVPNSPELKVIDKYLVNFASKTLEGLAPADCRVFVSGRQHGGKTLVLNALQRVFLQKVAVTAQDAQ
jgi:hypothetical protein